MPSNAIPISGFGLFQAIASAKSDEHRIGSVRFERRRESLLETVFIFTENFSVVRQNFG